jgi:hypothetical protein
MKRTVIHGIALFAAAYFVLLVVWIQIKPYYGYAAATIGVRIAAMATDVRVKTLSIRKDAIAAELQKSVWTRKGMVDAEVPLIIDLAKFTFNVPITFAILAGLYPFLRWRPRILAEAGGILAGVHILYIFFYSVRFSQSALAEAGVIAMPPPVIRTVIQFTWLFIDNMVIRFEPFLVAVYTYFRQIHRPAAGSFHPGPPPTSSRSKK